MPPQVRTALDRLTAAVRQFSLVQRSFLVVAVAAVVVGAVALAGWLGRPTMSPLFSGLAGADASAIVDQLTKDGVTYQLADGGGTILVPQANLYSERIAMAAAGLPANSGGAGYSLLDKLPVTASDFQQQTAYQRATEGELGKTVESIDGVEAATVKLALPQDSVFVSQQADPTASVFVRTRPGVTLTTDQVQAIVHLVSAGIPKMKTTDVAVVDASGQVLSAVGTGTAGGALASQQATDYESKVRQAVQNLLDPLVGPGKSAVTVTAQLNQDSSQTTTEKYSAPTPSTPPLASSTKSEQYTGSGSSATGVLGPDNIAVPNGGSGNGAYSSTSADVTNSIDKQTQVVTSGPGGLTRQSVSVAVDATAAKNLDMTALTSAISAAAGIDATRGDTLSVQRMAFDTARQDQAQQALADADAQRKTADRNALLMKAGIGGAALLLVIVLLVLGGRRSRRVRREALDLGELGARAEERPLLEGLDGLPGLPAAPGPQPEDNPLLARRREIEAMADEQPTEIAELLRLWMSAPSGGSRR
ncbi:MAG: flagellar M-ring protein FliF [Cellulomonas sp. 73-92]|uniref:flagellar basal-body MS-ring/collar protein FliF n=1 Tax=Cellulomonas sp. 73-92 TaxID=1895740 RepID=UPI00092B7DDD|nr:flagellar basal-body MS-ring/collar protein FliF [Cellulomonas sp. 73-92]OJV80705.1 MAG: flagellar M-ring protein FliF [Cellulomonas sp. 73-92]